MKRFFSLITILTSLLSMAMAQEYPITLVVDQKFSGYVSLLRNPATAAEGEDVSVIYYPNQIIGYVFKSIAATYTDADQQTHSLDIVDNEALIAEGRNAKKFVMPAYPVTVTVEFEMIDIPYAIYTNNDSEVTFYYDKQFEERNAQYSIYYVNDGHLEVDYQKRSDLTTATIDASMANYTGLTSLASCFSNCGNLTQISGLNYLNTANVTDMSYLFYKCDDLTQVDISSFNTASVTTMERMFDFDGNSMQSLAIGSGFTVGANTNIDNIFGTVSAWCPKTVYIHGTTEPDIKQNIFAKFDQESYVLQTDEGITLTGTQIDYENYKFIYKGGNFTSYNGKHFVKQYDPKYFVATPVFVKAGETVTVSITSEYQGETYIPKATYGYNWPQSQAEMTKTKDGYTFVMPDEEVWLEPATFMPILQLNEDKTVLTFVAIDQSVMHSMMHQQQEGSQTSQMMYRTYQSAQNGNTEYLSENELAFLNACHEKVEKVVFDESMLYVKSDFGERMLYGLKKLKTITGLENLNMKYFTSAKEMFAGCESLEVLTIASNFYVGPKAEENQGQNSEGNGQEGNSQQENGQKWNEQRGFDATDMFAGCTGLEKGVLYINGTTPPVIEQDIFNFEKVYKEGIMVAETEDLLALLNSRGGLVENTNDGSYDYKGGHFNKVFIGEIVYKTEIHPTVTIEGWTYGDEPKTPKVEANDGNGEVAYQYKLKDSEDEYKAFIPAGENKSIPEDAGVYLLKATIAETEDYQGATATTEFTIGKADILESAITIPKTIEGLVFIDNDQSLIEAGSCTFGKMHYSLDGESYSIEIPKGKEIKEYTVYYKVIGDKNHKDTNPSTIKVTIIGAYAELSNGGTTLTFNFGLPAADATYYEAHKKGWVEKGLESTVTTVIFDESYAKAQPNTFAEWFKDFTKLTSISGMEYLNMTMATSTSEMFAGCESLENLTIYGNFFVGAAGQGEQPGFDAINMFKGCRALAGGTLTIKGTTAPTILQDIFDGVFTEGSLVVDPECQLGNQVTTDDNGTKYYKGGVFKSNIEQPEDGEVTSSSTTINGEKYVNLMIIPKEDYEFIGLSVTYTDNEGVVHEVETTQTQSTPFIVMRFKMPTGYAVKVTLRFLLKPEKATEAFRMEAGKEWMTYYSGTYDLTLPQGLEAYYVSGVSLSDNGQTGTVSLTSTGNKLYKDVPALIHRSGNVSSALDITANGARHDDGETVRSGKSTNFLGTDKDMSLADQANSNIFVLRDGAFIKANPSNISAHRCWISLGSVNASRLLIRGGTTDIKEITTGGQQSGWYDMEGRKLDAEPVKKGVYIHNGKKIVVK